jgi:hypothetical protein
MVWNKQIICNLYSTAKHSAIPEQFLGLLVENKTTLDENVRKSYIKRTLFLELNFTSIRDFRS